MSRRVFLRTGTIGAAAAGAVVAIPGASAFLSGASTVAPEVPEAVSDGEGVAPALTEPVIAHVTDASSGELSIYVGEREIPLRDPALVQRLLRAAR